MDMLSLTVPILGKKSTIPALLPDLTCAYPCLPPCNSELPFLPGSRLCLFSEQPNGILAPGTRFHPEVVMPPSLSG